MRVTVAWVMWALCTSGVWGIAIWLRNRENSPAMREKIRQSWAEFFREHRAPKPPMPPPVPRR